MSIKTQPLMLTYSRNCPTLFLNSLGLHLTRNCYWNSKVLHRYLLGCLMKHDSSSDLPNVCKACFFCQNSVDFFPSEASTPVTRQKLRRKLCPHPHLCTKYTFITTSTSLLFSQGHLGKTQESIYNKHYKHTWDKEKCHIQSTAFP